MKPFPEALDEALRQAWQEDRRSARRVAEDAKLDHGYISRMRSGKQSFPEHGTFRALAAALRKDPEWFLEYRAMEAIALTLAQGEEPVEGHWKAARTAMLATQGRRSKSE